MASGPKRIADPEAEIAPSDPSPNPGLLSLERYAAGKRQVAGRPDPIKLSSNESSFGPSPHAVEAFRSAAAFLHRYSDPQQSALRAAIAEVHGLDPGCIVCGNGSDELLDLLIRAYVRPGGELLLTENHFEMCRIHGITQGARIVIAPEMDLRVNVDAILKRVGAGTRMVIIANPNNPTGTYLPASEVSRLQRMLPPHVVLVIDGAYMEYVMREDFGPGFDLVANAKNLVITRTFSKIYGLAALRIGWVYAPAEIVDVLERIRSPFNVSAAAQAAAAAAVRDQTYIDQVRHHNATWLERITASLTLMGLEVVPSVANFYLIRFDPGSGRTAAGAAAFLESRGIIPRTFKAGDSANFLRITVGLDHENEAVIAALVEYMK